MEQELRKMLKGFLDKYNVPKETIDAIIQETIHLGSNPVKAKHGAYVMTESASQAWDNRKSNPELAKNIKPQGV